MVCTHTCVYQCTHKCSGHTAGTSDIYKSWSPASCKAERQSITQDAGAWGFIHDLEQEGRGQTESLGDTRGHLNPRQVFYVAVMSCIPVGVPLCTASDAALVTKFD